jgi:EmrB/QacA subfamily drug resistance transporter
MLMASLDSSIANAGLPNLAQAFGASFPAVQWVVLSYLLAITTLIVSAGRLGDMAGRRRLLLAGIGTFTAASLVCGIAPTLGWLIAARVVQGAGAAIMMSLTLAFVGESVPKERTGSVMGLLGTTSALGTALGPSLGGMLTASFGWQSIFLVNVPIGLLSIGLAAKFLPQDRPIGKKPPFDALGSALLVIGLSAYALAMTLWRGRFGPVNIALIAFAALALAIFRQTQRRRESSLIRLDLLRDRHLSGALAMSLLVSSVLMSTLVVGPFYLSRALGFGPIQVGWILTVGPLIVAIAGVPAGRLADRLGPHTLVVAGLLLIASGALLLSLLPHSAGLAGYLVPIALITMGYAAFQTSNNTAVLSGIDPQQRGVISGLLSLARNLGLITGAAMMGAVFGTATGSSVTTASPEAVSLGMRTTFAVAAGLAILCLTVAGGTRRQLTLSPITSG